VCHLIGSIADLRWPLALISQDLAFMKDGQNGEEQHLQHDWSHATRYRYHENIFEKSGTKVLCQMQWTIYWNCHMHFAHRVQYSMKISPVE
jgi:hypothetical protein